MKAKVNKPGTRGLTHILQAAGYSMQGLKAAITHEEAFRLELMAMVVLLPLALWLGQGGVERALLVGSLLLVLLVELINSALEAVVDRVGVEHHELSGRAKDIGSAAVFIALTNVAVVWGLLLWERLVAA
jgi:diacylglycerol kinase (ATP)